MAVEQAHRDVQVAARRHRRVDGQAAITHKLWHNRHKLRRIEVQVCDIELSVVAHLYDIDLTFVPPEGFRGGSGHGCGLIRHSCFVSLSGLGLRFLDTDAITDI